MPKLPEIKDAVEENLPEIKEFVEDTVKGFMDKKKNGGTDKK